MEINFISGSVTRFLLISVSVIAFSLSYHVNSYDSFFIAIVSLFKTRQGVALIYAVSVVSATIITKILSLIFFGYLSSYEIHVVHDHMWETCVEILMIAALYKNIVSLKFFLPLLYLIMAKYFHWIVHQRIINMERMSYVSVKFTLRTLTLLNILFYIDFDFASLYSRKDVDRSYVQYIFCEQYLIMFTHVLQNTAKFILNYFCSIMAEPYIYKTSANTIIDFSVDLLKVFIYFLFSVFFIYENTFPLFIVIPLLKSMINASQRLSTLVNTFSIIREINKNCPPVSQEDVDKLNDKTCIICRDEMVECRKLACGHIFHSKCLLIWVQNGSTCPICRMPITKAPEQTQNRVRFPRISRMFRFSFIRSRRQNVPSTSPRSRRHILTSSVRRTQLSFRNLKIMNFIILKISEKLALNHIHKYRRSNKIGNEVFDMDERLLFEIKKCKKIGGRTIPDDKRNLNIKITVKKEIKKIIEKHVLSVLKIQNDVLNKIKSVPDISDKRRLYEVIKSKSNIFENNSKNNLEINSIPETLKNPISIYKFYETSSAKTNLDDSVEPVRNIEQAIAHIDSQISKTKSNEFRKQLEKTREHLKLAEKHIKQNF